MRVPTIGTNINGLIDAVSNNVTGILVSPYDSDALFLAMKQYLDNPQLIRRMGKAAQKRCKLLFNEEDINRLLHKEYTSLNSKYIN